MLITRLRALVPAPEKVFYWAIVIAAAALCAYEGVDAAGL
jgi:hypothetical protein